MNSVCPAACGRDRELQVLSELAVRVQGTLAARDSDRAAVGTFRQQRSFHPASFSPVRPAPAPTAFSVPPAARPQAHLWPVFLRQTAHPSAALLRARSEAPFSPLPRTCVSPATNNRRRCWRCRVYRKSKQPAPAFLTCSLNLAVSFFFPRLRSLFSTALPG